jgi:hypothetical protein
MNQVFGIAVVFYGIYMIIKLISEHFLRRKIINAGHLDKAEILGPIAESMERENKYPSLKWGLIALMAGIGLIIIEIIRLYRPEMVKPHNAMLPIGIELVFISLGFLIYFFIARSKKND